MKTILRNWGDFADNIQAVIVYVAFASQMLLFCWFGTSLTQHESENGLLLLLLTLLKRNPS